MRRVGRPRVVFAVGAFVVLWIGADLILLASGRQFDSWDFALLNTVLTIFNVLVAVSILSAENTQNKLEEERVRLSLQMAMIADRKITKALNHLVELRRAEPAIDTPPAAREDELARETDLHQTAKLLREVESKKEQEEGGPATKP